MGLALLIGFFLQDAEAVSEKAAAVAARACDFDPAVRAEAQKEAVQLVRKNEGLILKMGDSADAKIVLALAGKFAPDKLWAMSDARCRQVACDLLPPLDARIPDFMAMLRTGDVKTRVAAGRALGKFVDPAARGKIIPELGKMGTADPKLDVFDVLSMFVQSFYTPSLAANLGNYIGSAEIPICETAAAAIGSIPNFEPSGYFFDGASAALRRDALDLHLREMILRLALKGPTHMILPLLTLPDKSLRARVVDHVDANLDNPLLAKPLIDVAKQPATAKLDDGKDPSQPLSVWIEKWLTKLTGQEGGVKGAEEWSKRTYASLVDQMTDKAIKKGVEALKKEQKDDGMWDQSFPAYKIGATALAVYTLLKCDVAPDDKAVLKGLDVLLAKDPENTYAVSLMAMAMATAVEKIKEQKKASGLLNKIGPRLQKMADVLIASQNPCGGWSYAIQLNTGTGVKTPVGSADTFDFSNTQFAVLGLRAAANNGARVPRATWERALALYEKMNNAKDGGWPYIANTPQMTFGSTTTMTAAGGYGWLVCKTSINERLAIEELREEGPYRKAAEYLAKQWNWQNSNENFYYLYSLERMCMAGKMEKLVDRDWYADGSAWLLARQATGGTWLGSYGAEVDTCLALLFLKRAFIRTPYIETGGSKRSK